MATFILIHGAGDVGWYWHLVVGQLRARGHEAIAPDLPCDDDSAGLPEYADAVVDAIGDRKDLIVVAQSLGGFTAPLVCDRVPVELLILVAPMIPVPAEAPADYWTDTRYDEEAHGGYDDTIALFYHDVPPELAAEAMKRGRDQSEVRLGEPSPLRTWPDVPTRVLLCRDDRLLPMGFLRRVAQQRLGITPDEIDGGHTPALSRPRELADRLDAYAAEQGLLGRVGQPPRRMGQARYLCHGPVMARDPRNLNVDKQDPAVRRKRRTGDALASDDPVGEARGEGEDAARIVLQRRERYPA